MPPMGSSSIFSMALGPRHERMISATLCSGMVSGAQRCRLDETRGSKHTFWRRGCWTAGLSAQSASHRSGCLRGGFMSARVFGERHERGSAEWAYSSPRQGPAFCLSLAFRLGLGGGWWFIGRDRYGGKTEAGAGSEGCKKDRWYGLEVLLWCRRPGSSLLKVGCPEKFRKSDPPELPARA
jgi:hypothetical protein